MKYVVLAAGLALAACEQTAGGGAMSNTGAAEVQRISTMEQFQPLLDRRWDFGGGNYMSLRSNGTFKGDFGRAIAGTWAFTDGYWCRTLTQGAGSAPASDCQLVQGDGQTFTITRDKGKGKSVGFTLGAAL